MIHIDRSGVQKPEVLDSPRVKDLLEKAADFFGRPLEERAQERFRFDLYPLRDVRPALADLFYGKCAFCESALGAAADLHVDNFRPKTRAMGLDGTLFPDHYWWLTYEWTNLYPICPVCNRMKGTRFPIGGERAEPDAGPGALEAEEPLLLDPCRDYPEEHLVFGEDGEVASTSRRGQVTIEVFGLNREELVSARLRAYVELQLSWGALQVGLDSGLPTLEEYSPERLADPAQPYAGMRRQFLAQWMAEKTETAEERAEPEAWEEVSKSLLTSQMVLSAETRKAAIDEFQAVQKVQDDYSLEERAHAERYFMRTRMIERVEIRNFRVIEDLTLSLAGSETERAPWLMLLGENGTGKSSVLQAVALALAGEKYRSSLPIGPADVLRRGTESGEVRVFLTGGAEPITLGYRRGAGQFEGAPREPKVLLLAYGAIRLFPRAGATPSPGTEYARVDNLFNPFEPLNDATRWLLDLPEEDFHTVALTLKDLLSLGDRDRLLRHTGALPGVEVEALGTSVALEQLSDGYQSVLALTTDIMAVMLDRWQAMDVAEGIVLLDEVGAHLHPRWNMQIVKSLRRAFPRVQFLVSTHNPLCLRGLGQNEVVVMRRTLEDRIVALTDLPPVEGLRVDQLLTSEHFGLDSTVDPEIDAMFQEYYRLLAARERTEDDERRLEKLKKSLADLDLMGTTRRERLALEAVDQYLAQEPELLDGEERNQLKEETKRKVADIWSQVVWEGDD